MSERTMRAAVYPRGSGSAELRTVPRPIPGKDDVVVRLIRAAFNRNDLMTANDPSRDRDAILGSDGAGYIAALGPETSRLAIGDPVVLDPGLGWGTNHEAPDPGFQILGYPTNGTHAEYVVVPAANVHPKPENLTWDEAAALPLAGVTAWRALVTRGDLRSGELVLITGAGGGVATYLIQVATALGAQVAVTSSSQVKLEFATTLGASAGVLYTVPGWPEEIREMVGPADLVVDSSGVWGPALTSLRPGGRLVTIGRTRRSETSVDVHDVFWKQVSILGSSMGSPSDFRRLLEHVSNADWRPQIDSVWDLSDYDAAVQRLDQGDRVGKVVLHIADE